VIDNVGMSAAYDLEPWSDLMVAVVGAMAALAGLFFVALSINVDLIVHLKRLPGRSAATVVMLLILLLAGIACLIPGQSGRAVGLEIALLGVCVTIFSARALRPQTIEDESKLNRFTYRVQPLLIMLIPCLVLVVSGVSLMLEAGGGLYWLAVAFVSGIFACMTNAWVLLIEIKR
jgi:modulator of FtsH protease